MKKLILSVAVLFFAAGYALAANEFNVRGAKWGMTPDQIKKIETGQLTVNDKTLLSFDLGIIDNLPAHCVYFFDGNGKLGMINYTFESQADLSKGKAPLQHEDNYNKIKNDLTAKYGSPFLDEVDWLAGPESKFLLQDEPGTAVFLGDAKFRTMWNAYDNTGIAAECFASDSSVYITITYSDKSRRDAIFQNLQNAR